MLYIFKSPFETKNRLLLLYLGCSYPVFPWEFKNFYADLWQMIYFPTYNLFLLDAKKSAYRYWIAIYITNIPTSSILWCYQLKHLRPRHALIFLQIWTTLIPYVFHWQEGRSILKRVLTKVLWNFILSLIKQFYSLACNLHVIY